MYLLICVDVCVGVPVGFMRVYIYIYMDMRMSLLVRGGLYALLRTCTSNFYFDSLRDQLFFFANLRAVKDIYSPGRNDLRDKSEVKES